MLGSFHFHFVIKGFLLKEIRSSRISSRLRRWPSRDQAFRLYTLFFFTNWERTRNAELYIIEWLHICKPGARTSPIGRARGGTHRHARYYHACYLSELSCAPAGRVRRRNLHMWYFSSLYFMLAFYSGQPKQPPPPSPSPPPPHST